MEIVPEEAKVVRWIYHMFLEGIVPTAIATILTTASIPSPAGGDQWWPKTVMSILTNEKYYGAARLQKTYIADHITHEKRVNNSELPSYFVENGHPSIVPKAVFMEVQDRLQHHPQIILTCSAISFGIISSNSGQVMSCSGSSFSRTNSILG